MNGAEQFARIVANLRALGARNLAVLALVGAAVAATVGFGAWYLGQPERQALYTGLGRDEVGRIGGVLKDYGIGFDVSADGATVLVRHADAARARMLLAEKGLPRSGSGGYELFSQVGSLGLTSFMQDVTRTRALEGELSRTIQTMNGIRAARVHIVLPDRGSFRADRQPASAAVTIRTDRPDDASAAEAIRRLVAAAVPGMKPDAVTVLSTEGQVLLSADDGESASAGRAASLEQEANRAVEDKIRRTLAPYLGIGNFTVSVAARLNLDRSKTSETTFDPASRVERSVRVVRQNTTAQNTSSQSPTTVQQNIPAQAATAGGKNSNEENQRREEITNFEISSKTVETVRDGRAIERLSIAVLVNRARLGTAAAGAAAAAAAPPPEALAEIEQLVASAAGFSKERGDQIKIAAVPFAEVGHDLEPAPGPGVVELLGREAGTMIDAATILVVALLVILLGIRPALRAMSRPPAAGEAAAPALAAPPAQMALAAAGTSGEPIPSVSLIEDLADRAARSPQKRLEQMIEFDEEQAAAILRQWLRQDERA